ncbi:hypothetical protein ACFQ6Q_31350 [Streptomyces sp. NPDC056437]|uniref:hypothetical protein n=1 Tax=Streptomyces sp. NPDC056437 TaxID=3345816 RepID=UPI00369BD054
MDGGLLGEGVEGVIDVAEREPAAGEVDGGQGQRSGLVRVERMDADEGDQQLQGGVGRGGCGQTLDRFGAQRGPASNAART